MAELLMVKNCMWASCLLFTSAGEKRYGNGKINVIVIILHSKCIVVAKFDNFNVRSSPAFGK